MRRRDGMTLIEVVVVTALLGVALGAIFGTVRLTFQGMAMTERQLESQQSLRVAVDRMVEELRWGEEVLADPLCGGLCPDSVTVRIPPHNPRRPGVAYVVTFRRDAAQRELERRLGASVNNLAGAIERLDLRYFDAAGAVTSQPAEVVRIEVTVTAAATGRRALRTMATDVFLRNHLRPSPSPP
ncbi:MAG: PulJ/GspJ family protein [bacterium]